MAEAKPPELELIIDFSDAAERIYDEERENFIGSIGKQMIDFAVANENITITEIAVRFQFELTKALIEVIRGEDLESLIAGRLIDEIPELVLQAAALIPVR